MKSRIEIRDQGIANQEAENPFFPFDRYGNYVAEMTSTTSFPQQPQAGKKTYVDEVTNVAGSANPALGIA